LEWDDFVGVIPESFMRSYSRRQSRRSSISTGYNAVSEHGSSVVNSRPESPGQFRSTSTDDSSSPVATKRVRVKRSTDRVATSKSPLIDGHTIDFQAYRNVSIPFPLVFVDHFLHVLVSDATRTPSIAHELTRTLFAFRRDGLLETVGPAGMSSESCYILSVNDLRIR
jgi:putative membrane protein